MYSAVTRSIEVNVEPYYMADRSDPKEGRYVWAYRVTIDNQSDEFVKLLARHWQALQERPCPLDVRSLLCGVRLVSSVMSRPFSTSETSFPSTPSSSTT